MKNLIIKLSLLITRLYIKYRTSKAYPYIHKLLMIVWCPINWTIKTVKKIYKWYIKRRSMRILNKYMSSTCQLVLGLPGSGKTTFATYVAKLCKNAGYPCYTNFKCTISGDYQFGDLGQYDFSDPEGKCVSYWIFDEAGIDANNRNFKTSFTGENGEKALKHLKLMRHFQCRVIILSQSMDCDIKLRNMCARIWLLYKGVFTSNLTPVMRTIGCDEIQHQLMDMYDIASPLRRAFQRLYFIRKPYYKYFDTLERPYLPLISEKNKTPKAGSDDAQPKPVREAESLTPSKGMEMSNELIESLFASMIKDAKL